MNRDRFYEEMEIAYKKANNGGSVYGKQCRDFIVDVGTSFYQVDCRKYLENTSKLNVNKGGINNGDTNKESIE